ncbi:MAG: transposase [Robiginitomaculum sp.]|nr:MAG: transposase [Robiginitomaculum sp.]
MDRPDRDALDDATWEEAVAREAVIRRLLAAARMDRGDFYRACQDLGIKRSRLYELIRAYKAHPVTSSLVAQPAGMKNGSRRLPEETEAVIIEVINTFYKSRQKPNITGLHKEIRRLCRLRNLHVPSWYAVRSRIAAMDPAEIVGAREGAKAVRDRYRAVPGQYNAERAFEVVQIDHTLVDVIVVDRQSRQPLQRPWVTFAIDIASRMVAGFYLTLEPPSVLTVSLVIQHLVLPKEDWLCGLDIKADWPVAGLPETIHIDNAKEFRSRALKRGAEEHGIVLQYRPVAVPHYGGHIERLIGTMMGAVHLLPGTTFSNIQDRGDYDSAAHATMTLDELERWLTLEIFRYHSEIHSSLAIPPLAAWQDALARCTVPLRQPHDPASFRIDFLPSVERMVRRDGIHLFGLRYWDDVLSVWAGRHGRQLRVSYDPRDLSTVYVRTPDGTRYSVRFADLRHPPITLAEHRRAQTLLKERGLALVDEQLIFKTIEQQRAMVDVAMVKTREARRMAERRDWALSEKMTKHVFRQSEDIDADDCDDSKILDLPYYEVEEWS